MISEKCIAQAQSDDNTEMHQRAKNAVFLQNKAQYFEQA